VATEAVALLTAQGGGQGLIAASWLSGVCPVPDLAPAPFGGILAAPGRCEERALPGFLDLLHKGVMMTMSLCDGLGLDYSAHRLNGVATPGATN
jgi:hypothetical protein